MKAVVLAGGIGKRLRPLTLEVPKVMVPVRGEPLLTHTLRGLKPYVNSVVLVVGYLKEKVMNYFGNEFEGLSIEYVFQEEFKGTAHALLCAEEKIKEPFILVYGDTFFNPKVFGKVLKQDAEGVIVAKNVPNPEDFGVLELSNGFLSRILEKVLNPPSNLINAGIYLLPIEVFKACNKIPLSKRGEYELTDAINLLIRQGFKFKPVVIQQWIDVGTLERLKIAEQMIF